MIKNQNRLSLSTLRLRLQMNRLYKKVLLIALLFILTIAACKLDEVPILQASVGADTVMGITVVGAEIDNSFLTGDWKVVRTVKQYYDQSYQEVYGTIAPDKFTKVSLKDQKKAYQYYGLNGTTAAALGTYRLYTAHNVLFLQTPDNPFFSNPTSTIRITQLTYNTMKWVAMDTTLVPFNGNLAREAYQITFIK